MEIIAFVSIRLEVKGNNVLKEVKEQLNLIYEIAKISELESDPIFLIDSVTKSDITEI